MKVSLEWLKELVRCDAAFLEPRSLMERLSLAGFEVESLEDLASRCRGVVVGYVRATEAHPAADKLRVCQVEVGEQEALQIVCGAANVRPGIHVPVALVGSTLGAIGLTIKPAQLRGVASSGMICSLQELGLATESEGIVVLEDLLQTVPPPGSPIGPCLGLEDQVLELAITANRPDGLSMLGIAREVVALSGGTLVPPPAPDPVSAQPLAAAAEDQARMEAGGLFSLTALEGLRIAPSPGWLQQRLEKAGLRPINNVVDITNLVMLESGQPLHAFDQATLASQGGGSADPAAIGLRPGRSGERIVTLDGVDRLLGPEALVVTHADRPIALAGLMGGLADAVNDGTTAIWLEAAVFDPQQVRRSSRSVGLRSEASSRFEKGLPSEVTLGASDRAVALLQELAGARVMGRWLHRRASSPLPPITLRRDALHNLLGPVLIEEEAHDLPDTRITATLEALGCSLTATEEGWQVVVPPSRAMDLRREVDLIEEVARLVGFDAFACHLPDPLESGGPGEALLVERRLRRSLCAAGLQETCSFSLVAAAEGRIPLGNPLLADYGHLRDNLHEELLQAARRNLQASRPGFWAFEIGRVFCAVDPTASGAAIEEQALLVGVIAGERRSELWSSSGKSRPLDYYQARGVLQAGLDPLGVPIQDRSPAEGPSAGSAAGAQPVSLPNSLLHPGRCAVLLVEGRPAGWFGQLHPALADTLDLPESTHLFQLLLEPLLAAAIRPARLQPPFRPYPTVPASERDLALVVARSVSAAELMATIRKSGRPLLEQVDLLDRYEGSQVQEGHCSQAFRLRYRDPQRTLTDSDVEAVHTKVRQGLERQFGAQLRS